MFTPIFTHVKINPVWSIHPQSYCLASTEWLLIGHPRGDIGPPTSVHHISHLVPHVVGFCSQGHCTLSNPRISNVIVSINISSKQDKRICKNAWCVTTKHLQTTDCFLI